MIAYAETSAVLSWLLGEPRGPAVQRVLAGAEFVVTSTLTLIECDRAFHRLLALGRVDVEQCAALAEQLERVARSWVFLRITDEVVRRSRGAFPGEPLRSLDAIHLATALDAAGLIPQITLLSLDERVRRCAGALGLRTLPDDLEVEPSDAAND